MGINMAFINVKLTKEQREEIIAKKILNPHGSFSQIQHGISPIYITIDCEINAWLTLCDIPHDTDEGVYEFLLLHNERPIPLQAISYHNNGEDNKIKWEITRVDLPEELAEEKESIREIIKSAFKAYKVLGWPIENSENTFVLCGFREETGV